MKITQELLNEIAISWDEYTSIVKNLKREPNLLELGMFGALWSEHCGYKHTKPLINMFTNNRNSDSIGAVKLDNRTYLTLKIESHNHPSAVDPYQGAATGVGGIVRDILATGARPIALLNSLRFGNPLEGKQIRLLDGVVSGIADYGNSIGVPNVGGEIHFDTFYNDNPLVNVMCLGIVYDTNLLKPFASAPGDILIIAGARTGKDGIHGASGLASNTFQDSQNGERSAIQIGDPFFEKCLIEACLEVTRIANVIGMQDCGAGGITSAAVEMAANSDMGIQINVNDVPKRDVLDAYQTMLSESQERILISAKPSAKESVLSVFKKWRLYASVIGKFTNGNTVTVIENGKQICDVPATLLTNPPKYEFNPDTPEILSINKSIRPLLHRKERNRTPKELVLELLSSPNVASKRSIYQQYDHMVQNNTVIPPMGDAAVLRIKTSPKGIAVATDGNGYFCQLDPRIGASMAVAEASRNVSVTGAKPIALTDGLNFGNPQREEIKYQLYQTALGIRDASLTLDIPVVSGNASLYNETNQTSIIPTPIIGCVGLLQDVTKCVNIGFCKENNTILLIGSPTAWDTDKGLPGSEYAFNVIKSRVGAPFIDLELEWIVQRFCINLITDNLAYSAHDCSVGGVTIAACKSAIAGNHGVTLNKPLPQEWEVGMFGESPSRVIVETSEKCLNKIIRLADKAQLPCVIIGSVGPHISHNPKVSIKDVVDIPLSQVKDTFEKGLSQRIGNFL